MFGIITKLFILSSCIFCCKGAIKFTKITCEIIDNSTKANFEYCYMKAINRYMNSLNIKVNLPELVTEKITMRYELMQKFSGWKPFLYNITVDVCKHLKHPQNAVIRLSFQNLIKSVTSGPKRLQCPFQGALIFDNITNVESFEPIKDLPIPEGDFAEFTTWYWNEIPKAKINVYFVV